MILSSSADKAVVSAHSDFSVLFLVQLPPPIHGASVINQSIKESPLINGGFSTNFVSISSAQRISDLGRASLIKLAKIVSIMVTAIGAYFDQKPDLVYMTLAPIGLAFFKDALLALTLKALGAKLVYHLHGKGIKQRYQQNAFYRYLYRLTFAGVDVIHLSPMLTGDVAELVPAERIHIVNNGIVALDAIDANSRNPTSPLTFLFLSNLVREKGPLDFLTACAQLLAEGRRFQVVFAGRFYESDFEAEFRQQFESLNLPNVRLFDTGAYGNDKKQLLSDCHVMVLPTYYSNECFPLSLIEAMAAHMAIVATDEGAIADMVSDGENGLIVEKRNPASIAGAMRRLLDDPQLARRMGSKGHARYSARYTFEIFETQLTSVLQKILDRS